MAAFDDLVYVGGLEDDRGVVGILEGCLKNFLVVLKSGHFGLWKSSVDIELVVRLGEVVLDLGWLVDSCVLVDGSETNR